MKILKEGRTKENFSYMLIDWEMKNFSNGINVYPIAHQSANGYFAPKKGYKYLLAFTFNTAEDAENAFADMQKNGIKAYKEYADKPELFDIAF